MEKRTAQRRRVLKAGTIEFDGGAFSCMVRNLSLTGAALDVPAIVGIPREFTLIVPMDGLRLYCRSIWKKERRIGVTFDWKTSLPADRADASRRT
jgi:PilZ domain